ncbi:GNAT family N-acetyltransferase [Micromonospora sp. NPDC047738]|uniref:GNAT family N-acetyltransferase n=1 Tax=unclassified Micromonospora TaxID=2617518 RepID=UPI0033D73DBC
MSYLVEDDPAKRRFEILVDDALAGFTAYLPRNGVLVLTYTEVDERYRGMGVGEALVRGTLDQLRERGDRIVPQCAFVARFIERHVEYADLVVAAP